MQNFLADILNLSCLCIQSFLAHLDGLQNIPSFPSVFHCQFYLSIFLSFALMFSKTTQIKNGMFTLSILSDFISWLKGFDCLLTFPCNHFSEDNFPFVHFIAFFSIISFSLSLIIVMIIVVIAAH